LSEYLFSREFPRLADLVLWQISFDLMGINYIP